MNLLVWAYILLITWSIGKTCDELDIRVSKLEQYIEELKK